MSTTDPLSEERLGSLHLLTALDPYLRLGELVLMPPLVYFEWIGEKVNLLGDDNACGGGTIDSYNQEYRLIIPGGGCLEIAQGVRSQIWNALKSPSVFERHVAPCSEFELFGLRRGFLQHEDFITQLQCNPQITMRLQLTLSDLSTSGQTYVTAIAPATGSVHLKWEDVPESSGYEIYQGSGTSLTGLSLIDTVSGSQLTYDVTGLTPDNYYIFQVKDADTGDSLKVVLSLNCF